MGRDLLKLGLQDEFFNIFMPGGQLTITRTTLIKGLAKTLKNVNRFNTDDILTIGPAHSLYVAPNSQTTVGIFLYNKFIVEDFKVFGYVNKIFDGKLINKMNSELAMLLLKDNITTDEMADYLDKIIWFLGGPLSHFINPSLSKDIMKLPPATKKLKSSLFKENDVALKAGDAVVASKIEKELVDHAKAELMKTSGSTAMDIFNSGSGVDFANNYKTVYIMKGAVPDNREDNSRDFNVVTSNYDEGLSKEDFAANADSLVLGTYAKGKMTGVSGYYTKKYNSMFNRVELDKKDSDCGTLKTFDILITESNKSYWGKWHYHMVGTKPMLITPDNVDQYVGKTVKMRSPALCECKDPKFCNICYGDLPYIMDQTRVGVTYALIPNTRMNANLKKFHDMNIKLHDVTIADLMRFVK